MKFLSEMSAKLEGQNRMWVARLPEGSPSRNISFAMIHFLCKHLNYPDKDLPEDLVKGMPVAGGSPRFRSVQETCTPG